MSIGLIGALAGGAILGGGIKSAIDYGFSSANWKKQVEQEQKTYERNRADYLADLQSEREYNSPQQMINRIREAGLNPNLINGGQLVSAQASSGAESMPLGSQMSPDPVTSESISSGVVSFSNAVANFRETNARIINLELDRDYKRIVNKYEEAARSLGNSKIASEVDKNLQDIKKSLSDMSVNDAMVQYYGASTLAKMSEKEKMDAEKILVDFKSKIAELDAAKVQELLPYVGELAAAERAFIKAKTDKERNAANYLIAQKDLALTEAAMKKGLIDAGYASTYVNSIKTHADAAKKNAETNAQNAETYKKSATSQIVQRSFDTIRGVHRFLTHDIQPIGVLGEALDIIF